MSKIQQIFNEYEIELSSEQVDLFDQFLALFKERNSQINLSAIRDDDGIIKKHFLDSVLLTKYLYLYGDVLDIGTGGGFPGIPLKIYNNELNFTLLDSVGKKVDSCNHFVQELGLTNIKAIKSRAEDINKTPEFKKKYDFIVSRAVAYLPTIFDWAYPFLKNKGTMVIYKLYNPEEISEGKKEMNKKGFDILKVEKFEFLGQTRVFIFIGRKK